MGATGHLRVVSLHIEVRQVLDQICHHDHIGVRLFMIYDCASQIFIHPIRQVKIWLDVGVSLTLPSTLRSQWQSKVSDSICSIEGFSVYPGQICVMVARPVGFAEPCTSYQRS